MTCHIMESIQREPTVDDKPDEYIWDCLHNSVVLRTLMKHFSNTELLKLSLVNKLWNYEAKSLIRDRGTFPSFQPGHSTCKELDAFASVLEQMDVVPFSGMSIRVRDRSFGYDARKCTNVSSTGALDPSYDVILDRLPFKRLSLDIHCNSAHGENCEAILLAKKILRDFSEFIQELSINIQHETFLEDLSFPGLKILKIIGASKESCRWETTFMKVIVSRAPSLQQFQTSGSLRSMDDILEGSSAVVVPSDGLDPFDTELPQSGFHLLRIDKMVLLQTIRNFSVERFNGLIPVLLQRYRATLNTLHIAVKCIGPVMAYGICLPNVREFMVYMNSDRVQPCRPVGRLFKAFDFNRILPALTKVGVNSHNSSQEDRIQNFIEQGNAALEDSVVDRSIHVKHLCVIDYFSHDSAPYLSEAFPSIEKLSVKETGSSEILCGRIWKHWMHLKGLAVAIHGGLNPSGRYQHVDSVLCGIFPEEVAELRGKDDEFLKSVNIVPVLPSVSCFRDLRAFQLVYEQPDARQVHSDLLCSKVTGLVVFARCPNLSVTIQTNLPELEEAFGPIKPYASVVLKRTGKTTW